MEIDYDKDFKKVMTELQTNFGWSNIEALPDSYKDLLNDTIKAIKNCSIHNVVVNEAKKELKPCGQGDNICKCKDASECGYNNEVALCGICDKPQVKFNRQICDKCIEKTQQKPYT